MFKDFLTWIGWDNLTQWKDAYQEFQFYFATLLALFGGLYGWYKARASFHKAARLSEIVIETTGIGTRVVADKPGIFEHFLWIAPLKQVQLGELFNQLYIKSISHGGRFQARHDKTVIKLRAPSQTKAMLLRVRAAVKELSPQTEIISSAEAARSNAASSYRIETFYSFIRRDSWANDRFQSFRIVLIPKWIVEKTASEPQWLDQVKFDVGYQADRRKHIEYLVAHREAIDRGPGESGVIAVDFHFEAPAK